MFMSKDHDLQKILFGEIVFDEDFRKILKLNHDVKEDDDFKNAKYIRFIKISIYKMYKDIYKDINDVVYIGSTCETLKKCLSKFRKKSKSRVMVL